MERLGILKAQLWSAIAHDDAFTVGGERPPFARIFEFALRCERGEVVDESAFTTPGELEEAIFPDHDSLPKILAGEGALLDNLAGLELHLADGGLMRNSGTFVQKAVIVEESLGKCGGVVGIGVDDPIAVNRNPVSALPSGASGGR